MNLLTLNPFALLVGGGAGGAGGAGGGTLDIGSAPTIPVEAGPGDMGTAGPPADIGSLPTAEGGAAPLTIEGAQPPEGVSGPPTPKPPAGGKPKPPEDSRGYEETKEREAKARQLKRRRRALLSPQEYGFLQPGPVFRRSLLGQ